MQCFIQCLVQKEDPKQWPETLSRPTCNRMPQRGSERHLSELSNMQPHLPWAVAVGGVEGSG